MSIATSYIIVGQGLAGTTLAWSLYKEKIPFVIIDNHHQHCASKVAAGLYNPVVFKRMVKSWMVDDLLPVADDFYAYCEEILETKFWHKLPIKKIFVNEEEKNLWRKKSAENLYLGAIEEDVAINEIDSKEGLGEVNNAGWLDLPLFLEKSKKFFLGKKLLLQQQFNYDDIVLSENQISYKDIITNAIVFCEGFQMLYNPYFSKLPLIPTKGEVLTLEVKNFSLECTLNKGVFLLPLKNNTFKCGATYEWHTTKADITLNGKKEIEDKLQKFLKADYSILHHESGIRPTVVDRRPLLGSHPQYNNIFVFNGLGTKGVMLAPFFAEHMKNYLLNKAKLSEDVDIKRFFN
ncbi:MAG: FAD-dependent oxidoreductase [Bacteroidia bacterium]|nr:MAG: FAD-dependent oxidoreductase [Bacteroidia bacterium]